MTVRSRPPCRENALPFGFARPWLRVVALTLLAGMAVGSRVLAQPPEQPRPTLTLEQPPELGPSLTLPVALTEAPRPGPDKETPPPLPTPELPRPAGVPGLFPDEPTAPEKVKPVQLPPVPV